MFRLEHTRITVPSTRVYPRYYPGMTTAEYIRMYHWSNQIKNPGFHFIKGVKP